MVVSFIADDLRRTEASRLWASADKPWFEIDNGEPRCCAAMRCRPGPITRARSACCGGPSGVPIDVDFVLRRLNLMEDWFGDHIEVHPAGTGERIGTSTRRLGDR